ncbi:MAG: TorD/DmsD family molecular chaperone [Gammaproteobacteria bacterium]
MPTQAVNTDTQTSHAPSQSSGASSGPSPGLSEEQAWRAGAYALLAALLRTAPDQAVLDHVAGLDQQGGKVENEILVSLSMLALSARSISPAEVEDEYHALFIGLGRGELVPYGSWYQTGFLMEKPLGLLRDDLAALGFQRDESVKEPEDHVAALCEVMSMLIGEVADEQKQQAFFDNHMSGWISKFLDDLSNARSAVFYQSVARFGAAFFALEKRYLSLPV